MISDAEYEQRIMTVLRWVLDSHDERKIVDSGVALWGVNRATVREYLKSVNQYIAEQAAPEAKSWANKQLIKCEKLMSELPSDMVKTPQGVMAMVKLMEHQAKILNLFKTTVEVLPPVKEIGFKNLREDEA
jgi:hypothetical protein